MKIKEQNPGKAFNNSNCHLVGLKTIFEEIKRWDDLIFQASFQDGWGTHYDLGNVRPGSAFGVEKLEFGQKGFLGVGYNELRL